MKKHSLQLLIYLLLIPFAGYSQSKLKARISSSNKEGVPYASVVLKGTSLGTISNANGDFELALPVGKAKQQIAISCIGYKTQLFPIDSLRKVQKLGGVLRLFLPKQAYQLQEIVVGKQEILKDPKQIFAKAIKQLPNLLDDQPHVGKYYFRQSHQLDTSINRLVEAAISIYDPGINQNIKTCKFNIDELQSSLDNRNTDYKSLLGSYLYSRKKKRYAGDPRIKTNSSYKDSLIQKYLIEDLDHREASFAKFFISTNMIRGIQKKKRKKSLRINPHFENGRPIITESFIKEHRFKLDTIVMYNNEPVYKIKILPNKRYPQIKYQQHSLIPIGFAYIRIKDFAFLNLDYGYIKNPNYKHFKGKLRYYFHFKIRFEEFNKKLYLSYLYSNRFDYNSDLYRQRRLIQELVNTEIINEQSSINKQLNTLKWNGDHYEKLPYNKTFWKTYSIMLPTLEQENLKKNLEQEQLKK